MTTQIVSEPAPSGDFEAPIASAWDSRVVMVPDDWYAVTPPPRAWLLRDKRSPAEDGVLSRATVGLLVAQGGAGKTMMLTQLAVAIATGSEWLGAFRVTEAGRVLLVLGEEDAQECQRRLFRAGRSARSTPPTDAIDCLPLAGVECTFIATGPTGDAITTEFAEWMRLRVEREKYAAVLIDPLSRFGGKDVERDNAAATRAIQVCESIAASGATVIVAHHTAQWDRGRGRAEATAAASRGVTAITDGARWVMRLGVERLPDVDERLREIVTAEVVKTNYGRRVDPIELRRDLEYGGALVALDSVDMEMVERARASATPKAQKAATAESAKRARDTADDAAVAAICESHPNIGAREVRDAMREHLGSCSRERADRALRRYRSRSTGPVGGES